MTVSETSLRGFEEPLVEIGGEGTVGSPDSLFAAVGPKLGCTGEMTGGDGRAVEGTAENMSIVGSASAVGWCWE
jgi:hypothetical protein